MIPPITEAFFKELEKVFKMEVHHIDVDATMAQVQRKAGQRDVVEWCRKHIRSATVQGTVEVIVKP